ncbi:MAG: 4a-hydroxytetrahydrobiopterin dehydratase [Candidatus Omnitrophica bacterium]|nr:4a-hydroxytetrahydrobiopterin dehydratase [Candidatus Omnitrophota bacterium]
MPRISDDWKKSPDGRCLTAEYVMKDFMAAVDLIHLMALEAEALDHHPDIHLTGYRKLGIELSTHATGGLTEKDYLLAAKIDTLPKRLRSGG